MNKYKYLMVFVLIAGGLLYFYKVRKPSEVQEPTPATTTAAQQIKTAGKEAIIPAGSGRTVFVIKDKAESLDNIQSVVITIKEILVFKPQTGWVTVLKGPLSYDLLRLKKEGSLQLISDVALEPGTYSQIRFLIDKVLIAQNNITQEAKLPSDELKMKTVLLVKTGETSSATFDFLVDKSLHITGNNKYIFAPVINLTTLSRVRTQFLGKNVDLIGGEQKFIGDMGMDENGEVQINGSMAMDKVESVKNVIAVIPKDINPADLKISASSAIDTSIDGKYIDTVISAKAVTYKDKLAWKIFGLKNNISVKIYVDAAAGEVIGKE